jgi:transcriptional regulator with XRE-family HTH domain
MSATGNPDEIRDQIQLTREELGQTVEALAEKTDVGAQARRKLEETRATVTEKREEILGKVKEVSPDSAAAAAAQASRAAQRNPLPLVLAAALIAGFALGRITA